MNTYLFCRKDMFYMLDLIDDEDAVANAECNPGTLRVECVMTGKVVWNKPDRSIH